MKSVIKKDEVRFLIQETPEVKRRYIWIFFAIVLLVVTVGLTFFVLDLMEHRHTSDNDSCPMQNFDYLLLAVRWPPGFCSSVACDPGAPDFFQIHGLWPNYSNGSWPEFCCRKTPFKLDEVASLTHDLKV